MCEEGGIRTDAGEKSAFVPSAVERCSAPYIKGTNRILALWWECGEAGRWLV